MCNTACPASDQIAEFNELRDEDVLRVYSHMYVRCLPCPSIIFLLVRWITQLRAAAMTAKSTSSVPLSESLARRLHRFSPEDWVESYTIPAGPKTRTFARAFKAATILYALMSLPDTLSQPFRNVETTDAQASFLYYRRQLQEALNKAKSIPLAMYGMCWPTAVLGVAVHDGTAEEQTAVLDMLGQIQASFGAGAGAATLQHRLPEFWASGKNGWEDCFDRPFQIMS